MSNTGGPPPPPPPSSLSLSVWKKAMDSQDHESLTRPSCCRPLLTQCHTLMIESLENDAHQHYSDGPNYSSSNSDDGWEQEGSLPSLLIASSSILDHRAVDRTTTISSENGSRISDREDVLNDRAHHSPVHHDNTYFHSCHPEEDHDSALRLTDLSSAQRMSRGQFDRLPLVSESSHAMNHHYSHSDIVPATPDPTTLLRTGGVGDVATCSGDTGNPTSIIGRSRSAGSSHTEQPFSSSHEGTTHEHLQSRARRCCHWSRMLCTLLIKEDPALSITLAMLVNFLPLSLELIALQPLCQSLLTPQRWYELANERYGNVVILAPPLVEPTWIPHHHNSTRYVDATLYEDIYERQKIDTSSSSQRRRYRHDPLHSQDGHWEIQFVLRETSKKKKDRRPEDYPLPSLQTTPTTPILNCKRLEAWVQRDTRSHENHNSHQNHHSMWILESNIDHTPSVLTQFLLVFFVLLRWTLPTARLIRSAYRGKADPWGVIAIEMFLCVCLCIFSIALIGTEIHSEGCIEWWAWDTPLRLYQWQTFYWLLNLVVLSCLGAWWAKIHGVIKLPYGCPTFRRNNAVAETTSMTTTANNVSPSPNVSSSPNVSLSPNVSPSPNVPSSPNRSASPTPDERISDAHQVETFDLDTPSPASERRHEDHPAMTLPLTVDRLCPSSRLAAVSIFLLVVSAFLVSAIVLCVGIRKSWIASIWLFLLLMPIENFIRRSAQVCCHADLHRINDGMALSSHACTSSGNLQYLPKDAAKLKDDGTRSNQDTPQIYYFRARSIGSSLLLPVDADTPHLTDTAFPKAVKSAPRLSEYGLAAEEAKRDGEADSNDPMTLVGEADEAEHAHPFTSSASLSESAGCPPSVSVVVCKDEDDPTATTASSSSCIICWDTPCSIVASPCGHAVLCTGCCTLVIERAVEIFNQRVQALNRSFRWMRAPRPNVFHLVECPLCRNPVMRFFESVETAVLDGSTEQREAGHVGQAVQAYYCVWDIERVVDAWQQ